MKIINNTARNSNANFQIFFNQSKYEIFNTDNTDNKTILVGPTNTVKPYNDWKIIPITPYKSVSIFRLTKYGNTLWNTYDGSAFNTLAIIATSDVGNTLYHANFPFTSPKRAL